MIRFYETPWFIRILYPSALWRRKSRNSIYLTFDDGPHEEATPWVLDELKRVNAKATFFCLGNSLESNFSLGERLIDEGHLLCNHGSRHIDGWKISTEEFSENMKSNEALISRIGGNSTMFRPPYGRIKRKQLAEMEGRTFVMWSHLSWDFDYKADHRKAVKKLTKASPGSILLFHDSAKSFSNLKKLLPPILDGLKARNLNFETLQ